jgi:hypothetical protein
MRAAWVLLWLWPAVAGAEPNLRLLAVDPSACARDGVVKVELEELELEGEVRDFPANTFRLVLDELTLGQEAVSAQTLAQSDVPLSVALVLQADLTYRPDFERLTQLTRTFLRALPARTQVWVWTYGEAVIARAQGTTPDLAADSIAQIFAVDRVGSTAFQAWQQAFTALGGAPGRRFLVSVSDGKNEAPDRAAVRALGDQLAAAGILFHPLAYSPADDREPMLHLGELAKRSGGTFRLGTSLSDLEAQLANLSAQLERRWILSFAVPDRCAQPHQLQVGHGALRSEPRPLPAVVPPPPPVGIYVGIGVGVLALGAVGFLVHRRMRMG